MTYTIDRITLHWTAGTGKANATDRRAYHKIIEAGGTVVLGDHPPQANSPIRNPRDSSTYAAHVKDANTRNLGIALAGMRGAQEIPFRPGDHPITLAQIDAALAEVARDCKKYGIAVTRKTVLTHAEVEPTLGIKQNRKWDITWIPGMDRPGDPVAVGDVLRERLLTMFMRPVVSHPLTPSPVAVTETPSGERQTLWQALWQALTAILRRIFGGRA